MKAAVRCPGSIDAEMIKLLEGVEANNTLPQTMESGFAQPSEIQPVAGL